MDRDYNYEGKSLTAQYNALSQGSDKSTSNETKSEKRPSFFTAPKRVYTLNEVPVRYHIVNQLS